MSFAERIDPDALGCWSIQTMTGTTYEIDFDRAWMTRTPRQLTLLDDGGTTTMRLDGQRIDLVALVRCEIGATGLFILDLHVPRAGYAGTLRRTSPVLQIMTIEFGSAA